jgi:hypothetical protein
MPDFNSEFFKKVRADLNDALKSVGEKHGLTFDIGSISYLDDRFTAKMQGVKIGGKSVEAHRYEDAAAALNLPPLGTEFTLKGEKYVTKGLNKTGTSVIITRTKDQKDFVCKASFFSEPSFKNQSTGTVQNLLDNENATPLQKWIQRENIFAKPDQKFPADTSLLTLGQLTELSSHIENSLSPENLTCDGEVRGQALKAKEKNLNAVALEIDALIEKLTRANRFRRAQAL